MGTQQTPRSPPIWRAASSWYGALRCPPGPTPHMTSRCGGGGAAAAAAEQSLWPRAQLQRPWQARRRGTEGRGRRRPLGRSPRHWNPVPPAAELPSGGRQQQGRWRAQWLGARCVAVGCAVRYSTAVLPVPRPTVRPTRAFMPCGSFGGKARAGLRGGRVMVPGVAMRSLPLAGLSMRTSTLLGCDKAGGQLMARLQECLMHTGMRIHPCGRVHSYRHSYRHSYWYRNY